MGASGGPTIVTDSSLKLLIDPKDDVCNGGKSTMTDLAGTDDATVYSGMSVKLGTIEYASDTSIDMAIGDSYSITFWVNKQGSNSGNYAHILDNYASIRNWAVGNWLNTDQLFFEWRRADNAAWTATQLSLNLVQDEWNFVAITVTSGGAGGTKTIVTRLYNSAGAPSTTTKTTTEDWSDSGTGNFEIGRSQSNGTYFTGELSDVRVYKGVLSLSDINTIYNKPNTVLPGAVSGSQLVGWWPMTEGSGTKVLDNSSNSFHGNLTSANGSAYFRSGSATIPQVATGFELSSSLVPNPNEGWFDLNPSGSFKGYENIRVPDIDALDGIGALTLECWANINSRPDDWYFLIHKHASIGIYRNPSGAYGGDYPILEMWVASAKSAQSHADIRYNTWHHCVGVFNGTNNILTYIDGKSRTNATTAGPSTTADDSSIVYIGSETATGGSLHGKMTSVKIYDRVLSDKEIFQNYNAQRSRFGV